VKVISEELCVDKIIIPNQLESNEKLYKEILDVFKKSEVESITAENWKDMLPDAKVVVRTGECTPYSVIILVCGVIF
jgi:D-ribose pyranase